MKTAEEYFRFLESRFSGSRGVREELRIRIAGYGVRLLFSGIAPTDLMRLNLKYLMDDSEEQDETVYVWEDDLAVLIDACMIPEEERIIHYHRTADAHVYFPGERKRLSVRDNKSRTTFVVFPEDTGFPRAYSNKPFVNEMQWWLEEQYLLVHGAAVAADGTAVLITAPSGRGKSTLALSCLLDGMDYLAEDYVLISRSGPLTAYPVFCTGNLTEDSLRLLPEFRKNILYFDDERDKYLVDLSSYMSGEQKGIPLAGIIYPNLTDDEEPSLQPADSARPFVSALTAAAKQIKSQHSTADAFRILFRRLNGLPGYEMRMTHVTQRNARELKHFVSRLKRN